MVINKRHLPFQPSYPSFYLRALCREFPQCTVSAGPTIHCPPTATTHGVSRSHNALCPRFPQHTVVIFPPLPLATQVQPNITFSDTGSPAPIRFNPVPSWVPWANPVVLLSQYCPLSISCLSAHWALLGWVMPPSFLPPHLPCGGLAKKELDHICPGSLATCLGLRGSARKLSAGPRVYGQSLRGVGRMPGPSLLSSRHLLDIVASHEKLEMNDSTETKSFRKSVPSPSSSLW